MCLWLHLNRLSILAASGILLLLPMYAAASSTIAPDPRAAFQKFSDAYRHVPSFRAKGRVLNDWNEQTPKEIRNLVGHVPGVEVVHTPNGDRLAQATFTLTCDGKHASRWDQTSLLLTGPVERRTRSRVLTGDVFFERGATDSGSVDLYAMADVTREVEITLASEGKNTTQSLWIRHCYPLLAKFAAELLSDAPDLEVTPAPRLGGDCLHSASRRLSVVIDRDSGELLAYCRQKASGTFDRIEFSQWASEPLFPSRHPRLVFENIECKTDVASENANISDLYATRVYDTVTPEEMPASSPFDWKSFAPTARINATGKTIRADDVVLKKEPPKENRPTTKNQTADLVERFSPHTDGIKQTLIAAGAAILFAAGIIFVRQRMRA